MAQARLYHQPGHTMHRARTSQLQAVLCPKQRSRISVTRPVNTTGGCRLRVASWHASPNTSKCARRYQPLRNAWASLGHAVAVGGSGPCQSSTSATSASQQVHISARCAWLLDVPDEMNLRKAQLPATTWSQWQLDCSIRMKCIEVWEVAAAYGTKSEPS